MTVQSHDVLERGQSGPGNKRKGGHRNVSHHSVFESKQLFSCVMCEAQLMSETEERQRGNRTRKAISTSLGVRGYSMETIYHSVIVGSYMSGICTGFQGLVWGKCEPLNLTCGKWTAMV